MRSYEIINPDAFAHSWDISCSGNPALLSNVVQQYILDTWNPSQSIHVELTIATGDIPAFYRDKIEHDGLILGFILEWYCPTSTLRGRMGSVVTVPFPIRKPILLSGDIDGDRLAGYVILSFHLIVVQPDAGGLLQKGLVVCGGSDAEILLEGDRPKFPVQILPFKEEPMLKKYQNSFFFLGRDLKSLELSDVFSSSYTLFLNETSECTKILNNMVTAADSKDDFAEEGLLRMLMYNAYLEICYDIGKYSENTDKFASLEDFFAKIDENKKDAGSVGAVYCNLLNNIAEQASLSRGDALECIRSHSRRDSDTISQALQNLIDLRRLDR